MTPTEELKQEHRVIERMLAVLNAASTRIEQGRELPRDFFPQAVDFIRTFADKCHHGKEEDNLFPAMEKHGIPRQGGPVGVMLMEHDQGRAYVRQMDEAGKRIARGDKSAFEAAADGARGYADLLAQHIMKEDNILYPMADRALSAKEQHDLSEKFEEVEKTRLGPGQHEKYLQLVARLEAEFDIKS